MIRSRALRIGRLHRLTQIGRAGGGCAEYLSPVIQLDGGGGLVELETDITVKGNFAARGFASVANDDTGT